MLAAWGTSYLQQAVALDDAVEHIIGPGRARVFALTPGLEQESVDSAIRALISHDRTQLPVGRPTIRLVPDTEEHRPLGWILTDLRRQGVTRLHAAFPAPGDIAGLPAGPATTAALASGEAVIVVDGGIILVPTVDDPDDTNWTQFAGSAHAEYVSAADAQFELTEQLNHSTSLLTALDVPSWNHAYGRISRTAMDEADSDRLPAHFPVRATSLLHRGAQLAAILQVAARDWTGGAINTHEARARAAALAPLDRCVRQALAAAYNSAPH